MHSVTSNVPGPTGPDPHGEAALLLVESLIHFLTDRLIITHAEALHVVQIAVDSQTEISLDRGDTSPVPKAAELLSLIAASLAIDSL
jgi:hypothetical protein